MITPPPELSETVDLHTANVCIQAYAGAYVAARRSLEEAAERQLLVMRRLEETPERGEYQRASRAYYALIDMIEPMIIRGRVD